MKGPVKAWACIDCQSGELMDGVDGVSIKRVDENQQPVLITVAPELSEKERQALTEYLNYWHGLTALQSGIRKLLTALGLNDSGAS